MLKWRCEGLKRGFSQSHAHTLHITYAKELRSHFYGSNPFLTYQTTMTSVRILRVTDITSSLSLNSVSHTEESQTDGLHSVTPKGMLHAPLSQNNHSLASLREEGRGLCVCRWCQQARQTTGLVGPVLMREHPVVICE